jgi:hypothetical protein
MDFLRDISDFIDDMSERDPNGEVALHLAPALEKQMTALLHKLRAQIDAFHARRADVARERISYRCAAAAAATTVNSPSIADARTPALDPQWIVARRRSRTNRDQCPVAPPPVIIPHAPSVPECASIAITDRIKLQCVVVNSLSDVRANGMLYYVPPQNRFALHLAGIVMYGNIGNVYVSEPYPQKIHDCNMYPRCAQSCKYYHNPMSCAGSTDVRNFISASWMYSRDSVRDSKKVRKLSSREYLDDDIGRVSDADLAYYNEQTMHDLL